MMELFNPYIQRLCDAAAPFYEVPQFDLREMTRRKTATALKPVRESIWAAMYDYCCIPYRDIAVYLLNDNSSAARNARNCACLARRRLQYKIFSQALLREQNLISQFRTAAVNWRMTTRPEQYKLRKIPDEYAELGDCMLELCKLAEPFYYVDADELIQIDSTISHQNLGHARAAVWYYATVVGGATFWQASCGWYGDEHNTGNIGKITGIMRGKIATKAAGSETFNEFRKAADARGLRERIEDAATESRKYSRVYDAAELPLSRIIQADAQRNVSTTENETETPRRTKKIGCPTRWYARARAVRGISLEEAARNAGCSTGFLRHIENTGAEVTVDAALMLAQSLAAESKNERDERRGAIIFSAIDDKARTLESELRNIAALLSRTNNRHNIRFYSDALTRAVGQIL